MYMCTEQASVCFMHGPLVLTIPRASLVEHRVVPEARTLFFKPWQATDPMASQPSHFLNPSMGLDAPLPGTLPEGLRFVPQSCEHSGTG